MNKQKEIIDYIIKFLIGDYPSDNIVNAVGYTAEITCFQNFKVVIVPSGFFSENLYGTKESLPAMPLHDIEGVPLLFGRPEIERLGDTVVVHADIVASAFFLLSRYEEKIRPEIRDEHGRFPGRESLPFRAGFIHRPIVDEYGRLLRKWLRDSGVDIEDPPCKIETIYLTHDVDAPFYCRTVRSVLRCLKEGQNLKQLLKIKNGELENDPYYTFPWLLEQDAALSEKLGRERCKTIFFLKAGGSSPQDRPLYDLNSKDIRELLRLATSCNVRIGLHSSYSAGKNPDLIKEEKARLEKFYYSQTLAMTCEIDCNRHHFLASREPSHALALDNLNFREDFTMGYADVAGFRLGTSRKVHRFDLERNSISDHLVLHPLTIMDGTLDEPAYMNLPHDAALDYCMKLIEYVRNNHGELTLLWHNTSVIEGVKRYLRDLYVELLQKLQSE
ncbi:MAG: polysaccharide deacetylase family protein [Tannerella sp.]|jgi:hypothetical protein|nr:polysaccharide deacetylase family protein [Tannerella sp.]